MNCLLSICIPTYNRAPYTKELLIELINQINQNKFEHNIEICISDNGSTDNTFTEIEPIIKNVNYIKYYQLDSNKGADYNFYNVANMASNKYIWWFCSDDLPENDCLKNLMLFLQDKNPNILYLAHNLYSKNMQNNYGLHPYLKEFQNKNQFNGNQDFIEFTYMLGYIGAIIIKKSAYNMIKNKLIFNKSCYVHVAWVLELVTKYNLSINYYNIPLIKHRLDNDSFIENNNLFKRMMIDINGYKLIGKHFLDKKSFYTFYSNVYNKHVRGKLMVLAKNNNWFNCLRVYIINFSFMFKNQIFYTDLLRIFLKRFIR